MPAYWIVLLIAAVLAAGASLWVLRAYRGVGDKAPAAPVLIACAAAALGALVLYLFIGRPDLPDQPYTQRLAALRHRDPMTYSVDEAVAVLSDVAKAHPSEATPHILIGQLQLERGMAAPAVQSFDAALRRDPQSREAMLGLAQAMVSADDGHVSPEALRLFQTVAAQTQDPIPLLYEAKAALQAEQDGRPFWAQALARMGPDSPLRPEHASDDWRLGLARALVRVEGRIAPETLHLFQLAGASSRDPTPWIYQAMAAMQAGQDPRHFWAEALARMALNDPRRAMAQSMSTTPPPAPGANP